MSALSPADWIAIAAITVPVVGSCLVVVVVTARKTGAFESKFGQVVEDVKALKEREPQPGEWKAMKASVEELEEQAKRIPAFDTAVQLLTQSMHTMQVGFVEFRKEAREGRATVAASINALGGEIKGELREVRHDVNNLLTGKVVPAKRQSGDSTRPRST
jgi:DNA repair ATPase RecN